MSHVNWDVRNLCSELSTVRDLLRFAVGQFNANKLVFGHGSATAYDEAAYLILYCLHLSHEHLDPFFDARLTSEEKQVVFDLLRRRIDERLPAAYLTGEAWLHGYRFKIDTRAIIPRSFIAELFEEHLVPWVDYPDRIYRVLDLCTGSGCLAIIAALTFPNAQVDAVDLSPDALMLAQENIDDYGLEERIRLTKSDLFASLENERYDLIISNPPYVKAEAMASLPPEYRAEPAMALAGGEEGLDFVHRILECALNYLEEHGTLIVEIGHNRAALEAAYPETAFTWLETAAGNEYVCLLKREDLAGLRRVTRK